MILLWRDLVLLQFSIRHFVSPGPDRTLRKFCSIVSIDHAASKALCGLSKFLNLAERCETGCEVLQSRLREVSVCIAGEKRSVDRCFLKSLENLASLLGFLQCCWIIHSEEHWNVSMSYC